MPGSGFLHTGFPVRFLLNYSFHIALRSVPAWVSEHVSVRLINVREQGVGYRTRETASYDRRRREQVQRRSERAHASELTTTLSVASSGAGLVRRPARISERAAGAGTSSEWEGDLFDSQFQAWI